MLMGTLMLNGCALSILMKPFCSFKELAGGSEKNEKVMDIKSPIAKIKQDARTHGSTISLTLSLQRIPSAQSLSGRKQLMQKLNQVFNPKMLLNTGVLFTFLQCLLFFLAHPVVQIFLPNVASVYGIDGGISSMMLSILAISDFIARLGFGFIGSIQRVNKSHVVIFLAAMSALGHVLMAWINSSIVLFFLVSSIGISQGKTSFHWICALLGPSIRWGF